ncbi:MAG: hypothetical protein DHS20C15_07630 [Planctomycetota bacterium]|nr:MAG: hypothetical protein DHS20C15_07630 [Planctomycetota bacterium]
MPTYDYECRFCEHRFEHFQGINDAKLRKCPECGRNGLDRLFGTGAGVVFKGSGFYETDYKRAGDKPTDKPSTGATKTPASSGDTSSTAGSKSTKPKAPSKPDKSDS